MFSMVLKLYPVCCPGGEVKNFFKPVLFIPWFFYGHLFIPLLGAAAGGSRMPAGSGTGLQLKRLSPYKPISKTGSVNICGFLAERNPVVLEISITP